MARAPDLTPEDRSLAEIALEKRRLGRRPTVRETAALRKAERAREEVDRDRLCRAVPHHFYLEIANITTATAKRHAANYALPCRGRTIDLAAVLAAVHALLEEHGHRLVAPDDDDPTLAYRREKAELAKLQRLAAQNRLLPREDVHVAFQEIAAVFRSAAATIAKQWPEAADCLTEALDDALAHPYFSRLDPPDARE